MMHCEANKQDIG